MSQEPEAQAEEEVEKKTKKEMKSEKPVAETRAAVQNLIMKLAARAMGQGEVPAVAEHEAEKKAQDIVEEVETKAAEASVLQEEEKEAEADNEKGGAERDASEEESEAEASIEKDIPVGSADKIKEQEARVALAIAKGEKHTKAATEFAIAETKAQKAEEHPERTTEARELAAKLNDIQADENEEAKSVLNRAADQEDEDGDESFESKADAVAEEIKEAIVHAEATVDGTRPVEKQVTEDPTDIRTMEGLDDGVTSAKSTGETQEMMQSTNSARVKKLESRLAAIENRLNQAQGVGSGSSPEASARALNRALVEKLELRITSLERSVLEKRAAQLEKDPKALPQSESEATAVERLRDDAEAKKIDGEEKKANMQTTNNAANIARFLQEQVIPNDAYQTRQREKEQKRMMAYMEAPLRPREFVYGHEMQPLV